MKRFTTASSAEPFGLEFQVGALLGYYDDDLMLGAISALLFARSHLGGHDDRRYQQFKSAVAHGRIKRAADDVAGRVVRL